MRFLALATLLFVYTAPSFADETAAACPQLNGHYTCTYDGSYGHHVFELDGRTYLAYLGNQVGRYGFGLAVLDGRLK